MSFLQASRCLLGVLVVVLVGNRPALAQTPKRTTHGKPTGAETSFTNADVVKLVRAGMADAIVIAKIERAPKERLDTSTDALVQLKGAGASQAVIEAVMRRAGNPPAGGGGSFAAASKPETAALPPAQSPAVASTGPTPSASGPVSLFAGGRWTQLGPVVGKPRKKLLVHYVDFDGRGALARTGPSNPKVQVRSTSDVRGSYYLVRLEVLEDKGVRTLKYGGKEREPDEDFAVATDVQKTADGSWLLAPTGALKPGEYGVFTSQAPDRPGAPDSIVLYEFAIDEHGSSENPAVASSTSALANTQVAAPASSPAHKAAGRSCLLNFKSEGGYWKGSTYTDFEEYPNADRSKLFEKLLQAVVTENFTVSSSSKDSGTVSASFTMSPVMGGAPHQAPLSVILKDSGAGGVRADIRFLVPAGCKTTDNMVKESFCHILEAAE